MDHLTAGHYTAKPAADDHDMRAPISDLGYLSHIYRLHTSNSSRA